MAAQRANFAFETTLAGRAYAGWLNSLRQSGYAIHLFYFWLDSPDLAITRVAARVKRGGHAVPDVTIRDRFGRSIRNLLELYIPVVTGWKVYDNSSEAGPRLVAKGRQGQPDILVDPDGWSRIQRSALNA